MRCYFAREICFVLYIRTFRSMCALPNKLFFCSSLISCFPGMLLRYCLSNFEMVPVAPIISGITFAFTFHMRWISNVRNLYYKIFSASFLIAFLSPRITIYIIIIISSSIIAIAFVLLLLYYQQHVQTFCVFNSIVTEIRDSLFRYISALNVTHHCYATACHVKYCLCSEFNFIAHWLIQNKHCVL